MTTFTKWFLLNSVILTSVFLAEQKDIISRIIENDLSRISILIISLYVIVSGYIGRLCYLADKINEKKEEEAKDFLEKRAQVRLVCSRAFFLFRFVGNNYRFSYSYRR